MKHVLLWQVKVRRGELKGTEVCNGGETGWETGIQQQEEMTKVRDMLVG